MEHLIILFFSLCVGHALADFALQNQYVATFKSHKHPEALTHWPWVLLAHSLIHGGAVFLITGHLILGLGEVVAHAATDYLKSDGKINYHVDQTIHYLTKVVWAILALTLLA